MLDFAEQWSRAEPKVTAFLWSLVPNRHDVDDLLQRTAQTLFVQQDRYDQERSFSSWAIGVARIEVLRFRQERGRDRLVFDDETIGAIVEVFDQSEAELEEVQDLLAECIGKLTNRLHQVLRLHHYESLESAAIAHRLGMTHKSVHVALHRARTAVRACIENGMYGSGSKKI